MGFQTIDELDGLCGRVRGEACLDRQYGRGSVSLEQRGGRFQVGNRLSPARSGEIQDGEIIVRKSVGAVERQRGLQLFFSERVLFPAKVVKSEVRVRTGKPGV